MSADNGIYILKTNSKRGGYEYRVRELMAIENIDWDHTTNQESNSDDIRITNARQMWKDCEVFIDESKAMAEANRLLKETFICEYGISYIFIYREFNL
jgi:pectate lyase